MSINLLIVKCTWTEKGIVEKGIRSKEQLNINKSLLYLENCFNIFSDIIKKDCLATYIN